jgi:hypothetical protein
MLKKYIFTPLIACAVALAAVSRAPAAPIAKKCDARYQKCDSIKSSYAVWLSFFGGTALAAIGTVLGNATDDPGAPAAVGSYEGASRAVGNLQKIDPLENFNAAALKSVQSGYYYARNSTAYAAVGLDYALARGLTGAGSQVAILDNANDWHGRAVNELIKTAAPSAQISQHNITNPNGSFRTYSEIAAVIRDAGRDGIIYNGSWGIPVSAQYNSGVISGDSAIAALGADFVDSVRGAARNDDAIFVWAAGNDGAMQSNFISGLANVFDNLQGHFINVVAYDLIQDSLADFSNACGATKSYCLTAPGTGINAGLRIADGTSFAAPIVSASAALLKEMFPYLSAREITEIMFITAQDLGDAGVDEIYGWGMLDMENATRPIGQRRVMTGAGGDAKPLAVMNLPGGVGARVAAKNLRFVFFDSYNRAFGANLNDYLTVMPAARLTIMKLREFGNDKNALSIGDWKFGFSAGAENYGENFLGLDARDSFVQYRAGHRVRLTDSVVIASNAAMQYSTAYSTVSTELGFMIEKAIHDKMSFGLGLASPMAIKHGSMNIKLPVARSDSGAVAYEEYKINLREKSKSEFAFSFKAGGFDFYGSVGADQLFMMKYKTSF